MGSSTKKLKSIGSLITKQLLNKQNYELKPNPGVYIPKFTSI